LLKKDGVPHRVLNAKHHEEEGEIIAQAGRKEGVTIATNMAGRGVDIVLGGNPPDAKEAEKIKNTGGLFVIGTERHEARRIDNQLRGRGGRQGDPGKTRFYVSLEDDLMRIFGSGRIKNMMGRFGIPENQPIENRLVSKAIESAQSKIEGFNFDARKHILDYDNVMNVQRNKIYGWRRQILFSDNDSLKEIIKEIFSARGGSALGGKKEDKDFELLEKRRQEMADDTAFFNMQRFLLLRVIDMLWVDHLETMEYMRSSVGLRAYGQRDPLVEYKNEGVRLFRALEAAIRTYYCQLSLQTKADGVEAPAPAALTPTIQLLKEKKSGARFMQGAKIGRNDPCPCGSGKKYKKCHGK